MMLSPLLKLDIAWKAECLDGWFGWFWLDDRESFSEKGDESTRDFRFKLRFVDLGGIGRTIIGRTRLVLTSFCPRVRFSIGFWIGTGTTTGFIDIGKASTTGNPPPLPVLEKVLGDCCDWDVFSWWWSTESQWSSFELIHTLWWHNLWRLDRLSVYLYAEGSFDNFTRLHKSYCSTSLY